MTYRSDMTIDPAKRRQSSVRAGRMSAQQIFKIDGQAVTMRELLKRTGKSERQLRYAIRVLRASDKPLTFDALT